MLHRAILGSFERFIGILIEHYAGNFPTWLAPIQLAVISLTDRNSKACIEIYKFLSANGFRVQLDLRNEKMGYKIREHTLDKIPFILIIGDKEEATNTYSIRTKNGKDLGAKSKEDLIDLLNTSLLLKGVITDDT